jgi:peptide/nickel transport system permease protein
MTVDMANVPSCIGEVVDGKCYGTWEYPLGTTQGGKGVFASIVHGMTISMKIGFIATMIAVTIATTFGTVSAYAGGLVDEVLMRYVDIQQSWPTLVMYLLIIYIYGGGLGLFILLFGLFSWGGMARYVRSKALSVSEEEYIKAVRVSGASKYRVVRRHVVPNTASSIITDITLLIPAFLLAEAQLAFLGLGDPEIPSWGQLISAGRSDLAFAPWIVLVPGIVLFLTILAFNFLGDALLDALNPEAEAEADR